MNGQLTVALTPTAPAPTPTPCRAISAVDTRPRVCRPGVVCKCGHRLGVPPGLTVETREEVSLVRARNILEL